MRKYLRKKKIPHSPSIFKLLTKRLIIGGILLTTFLYFINIGLVKSIYRNTKASFVEDDAEIVVDHLETSIGEVVVRMQTLAIDPVILQFIEEDIPNESSKNLLNSTQRLLMDMELLSTRLASSGEAFIINLKENYVITPYDVKYNIDFTTRPWYEDVINDPDMTILTPIYTDLLTNNPTMTVITKIKNESDEVIGFIGSEIFIQNLMQYINSSFKFIEMDSVLIDHSSSNMYSSHSRMHFDEIHDLNDSFNQSVIVHKKFLGDRFELVFYFNEFITNQNWTQKILLIGLGLFYIVINFVIIIFFVKFMQRVFSPLYKNINLLKDIVKEDENLNVNFNELDEFQQLESLTNSIYDKIHEKLEETHNLIYYDNLTELPNRELLKEEVSNLIKDNLPFALVFLSLNDFKNINSLYGNTIGDTTLILFGKQIQDYLGDKGLLFRYSGDEFVIIYKNFYDKKSFLESYEQNPLQSRSFSIAINDLDITLSFSIGCSIYPEDGGNLSDLLKRSYFIAEENKKYKYNEEVPDVFFNEDLYNRMIRQVVIKSSLKEALLKEEFKLYFQPIHSKNGIVKCEVLIRWFHNQLGLISPAEFIHYAEEIGEITSIGNWIIRQSFKYYNILSGKYYKDIDFSINISGLQLCENDFAQHVDDLSQIYGVPKNNIVFEITENILIHNNKTVMNNLTLLKELGFKLAIDDFGTGYSSFSYLEKFNMDILKIDKSFIDNKMQLEEYKLVEHLINIAHALNLEVVVEGVETKEQYAILESIGCDFYQGYYFSKPLDFEGFINYSESN